MTQQDPEDFETEEEETEEPEAPEPEAAVAQIVEPPQQPSVRQPAKRAAPKKASGVGKPYTGHLPTESRWSRDAEEMWDQMLAKVRENGSAGKRDQPCSAHDLYIVVKTPAEGRGGGLATLGKPVNGDLLVKGSSALVEIIDRSFHFPNSKDNEASADYAVEVRKRSNGGIYGKGYITRPSVNTIKAIVQAQGAPVYPNARGAYAPPAAYPEQAPQGYGAPPAQPTYPIPATAGPDPRDAVITQLLEHMQRLGVQPPAGVAAPPPAPAPAPQDLDTRIATAVATALRQVGIGAPPTQAQPVQQPPTRADSVRAERRAMVSELREDLDIERDFLQLRAELRALYKQKTEPEEPETEAGAVGVGAPAAVEPAKPEDLLPFNVVDIPGTGNPGTGKAPVRYAVSKETGDLDLKGAAFANMEHLLPFAEKALNSFGDLVKHIAQNAGMAEQQGHPGVGRAPVQQLPQETNGAAAKQGDGWSDS